MTAPPDVLLARAYAGLDSAGVRWAGLRDEEAGGPSTEVDLLVAPADLRDASSALAGAGFAPLATRGLGTHRFFLTYDGDSDRWVKLDVVTELSFGRRRELPAGKAKAVLERRMRRTAGWALSPADEFWALAFHCALDRRAVAIRHRQRLMEAAGAAGPSPLTEGIDGWLLDSIVAAAASGDDAALLGCAAPLRRAVIRSRPGAVASRLARHAGARGVAKLAVPARPGLLVALLGPDGSGKSTLAAALRSVVPLRSRLLYGGLYARGQERPWSRLLHLARFGLVARYETRRGGIVIADRHPLESQRQRTGVRGVVRRCLSRATPDPDLALVLDCDGDTMFGRKGEHSPAELEAQRRRFRALAEAMPRATVLDARLSPEGVRAGASLAVWERLRATDTGHSCDR